MYFNELKKVPLAGTRLLTTRQLGLLKKLGIESAYDALSYFPFRYEDRSRSERIADSLLQERPVTVIVRVIEHQHIYFNKKRHPKILVQDETTRAFLVGFNRPFLETALKTGKRYWLNAQFVYKFNEVQSSSFDFEEYDESRPPRNFGMILPVYRLTEGLYLKELRAVMKKALAGFAGPIEDELPGYVTDSHRLMPKKDAIGSIHFPAGDAELKKAKLRLAFEEFFAIQLAVNMKRSFMKAARKDTHYAGRALLDAFLAGLPYALTGAQKRVLDEVLKDMEGPSVMHRLLQGDVGSGKTTVAAAALVHAAGNGFQGALMVPTEVLASQHFDTLCRLTAPLGPGAARPVLLTGSMPRGDREDAYKRIADGSANIAIGTHALIQDDLQFRDLKLIVYDEQHKFGVEQRIALARKAVNPDILVMTATPIPRTLTLTLYGDLDVSLLDEMPADRKPVVTRWVLKKDLESVLEFTAKELKEGRQAFFIYPLIEESEKTDAENATRMFNRLRGYFQKSAPGAGVGLLHGRLSSDEKRAVMNDFRDRRIAVLVSTTVIEVGIDVKTATVMVIEGADRFGLSQLHQLRGRVGRGSLQSYCILVTPDDAGGETARRMKTMVSSADGFVIAEEDLKIRGPGEILGTEQSGLPELKIADYFADEKLLSVARQDAKNILSNDPELSKEMNIPLKKGIIDHLPADYLRSG